MKQKIKKILVVLYGIAILSGNMQMVAHAQELMPVTVSEYVELTGDNVEYGIYNQEGNPNVRAGTLGVCRLGKSVSTSGVVASIETTATATASKIGVRDVVFEKYIGNGEWEEVASHPGGYVTNSKDYDATFRTSSAQEGVTYRVTCVHYAVIDGVEYTLYNTTNK